ncbi:MAG: endolytic transglycosylase MltG [Wenzhouxiangella sp.]|nr:MAG: endolytic transglycosylase MltG [Wenzhouxiangella sp.]
MRLVVLIFLSLLTLAGLFAALAWRDWSRFQTATINPDGELILWMAPGTSFSSLVRDLERLGLASQGWQWRVVGRLHGADLKAGEYAIPAGMTVPQLLERLQRGQTRQHRLTIVEGWTLARLRAELAGDPRLRPLARGLSENELMTRLGCGDCFGEGRFLPETYFFKRGDTDLEVLERAYQAMDSALESIWATRRPDLPIDSKDDLLVLASIIERETGQDGERAQVAGVFVRRLEIGMRLQTDPTVIYGLGDDFQGRLRRVHLRTDHPWNTYTRHGLPPTPIALPGRSSLHAAANPAAGTTLYFVARGDGTHQFSDTLEEHNAAVNRYIRGRR